jgi:hypothetical protein
MIGIKAYSGFSNLGVQELQTVIVYKDVGGSTLELISRDGLLEGLYGWRNHTVQPFLVYRTLNGYVRETRRSYSWWRFG